MVKVGENPNIQYPQCERSIKKSVFKQQCVPNTGTNAQNGGNWGNIREKFARRFFFVQTLASWQGPLTRQYSTEVLEYGTRESSRNQESEQSSATIVPQLSVMADMTRRQGELKLKPEDAAGVATPIGIPQCYRST